MKKAQLTAISLCIIFALIGICFVCLIAFPPSIVPLFDEIRPFALKALGFLGDQNRFGLIPVALLMLYLGFWILTCRKPYRPIMAIAICFNLYHLCSSCLGFKESWFVDLVKAVPVAPYVSLSVLLFVQVLIVCLAEGKRKAKDNVEKKTAQPHLAEEPAEHVVNFETIAPNKLKHPEPPKPTAQTPVLQQYGEQTIGDVLESAEPVEEVKPSYPSIFDVIAKENQIISSAKPRRTEAEILEEKRRFAYERQKILEEERLLLERKNREEQERQRRVRELEERRLAQEDEALQRLSQRNSSSDLAPQSQSLQQAAAKIAMDLEKQSLEIAQRLRSNHVKAKEETYFKPLEEQNKKVLEQRIPAMPDPPNDLEWNKAEQRIPTMPDPPKDFELNRAEQRTPAMPDPPKPKKFEWDRARDYKEVAGDKTASSDLFSGVGNLRSAEGRSIEGLLSHYEYELPQAFLLTKYPMNDNTKLDEVTLKKGHDIVDTLEQFHIKSTLRDITKGPTVTLYEIALAPGVKISALNGLTDNLAMQLAVGSVRLITPIPGKQAVGVEVPNGSRQIVGFSDMLPSLQSSTAKVPMVLGKTITGEAVVTDLASAPHVLIAGSTGSGKSVCVNSLVCSILYTKTPKEVRMIMVDPKVVELNVYNDIPHLLTPVITEPKKAIKAMQFCIQEMTRRYDVLSSIGVRNIAAYNEKVAEEKLLREKLPYIVVIMDEFADLMTVAGKELEGMLHRLSAMARAVGIHLVFATQRPSADVVTGLIKSNLPTKIAFAVNNQINSRIILDSSGAETLLGKGDMLFASATQRDFLRIQGAFLSDKEVEDVVNFVKKQGEPDYLDDEIFEDEDEDVDNGVDENGSPIGSGDGDIFDKALEVAFEHQTISTSYLQRRLGIGYNKAANLIEKMEKLGYVGPPRGSKPREVLKFEK